MLSSTCLAVVLVPAFFVMLQRIDEKWKGKKDKPAPTSDAATPETLAPAPAAAHE
jgi:hydrophobic/amphiphilic exporter-1 (mainly G- bacteria), HAE1 family